MGRQDKQVEDLNKLLASRHANGADFWATADGRLGIERPISTLTALLVMSELKVPRGHEALEGALNLVLTACQPDGRVRISPKGAIYPCHTALAAAALCRHGLAGNNCVKSILEHLLSNRYEDGGWRCNKFIYGRGRETEHSNPGVTLFALDAFRCAGMQDTHTALGLAVDTLLSHWDTRLPIGPCHYGIGTLFMQVEYPFLRYNLFYYTYVLSFYARARHDRRFWAAFDTLRGKVDSEGRMIVERPNRKLSDFNAFRKGEPSASATERFKEIVANLEKH